MKKVFQIFSLIMGGILGYLYLPELLGRIDIGIEISDLVLSIIGIFIGAIILFILILFLLDPIIRALKKIEEFLLRSPVIDIVFGSVGLVIGLIIAVLAATPFKNVPVFGVIAPVLFAGMFGYLGIAISTKKFEEIVSIFRINREGSANKEKQVFYESKILDTSVIIDGRIADICKTGFIEGKLVIPQFILEELQHIADSSDSLKRNRGRRGLDVLNKIRKELDIPVEIYDGDFDDIQEVDSKLVKLAKQLDGKILTNDYNLNKVSELQGVQVLNINDLANAVKPVVLPGEEMRVLVIKEGKEFNQGIAYLDDGTMIVVEEGKNYLNETIDVLVTSILQTSAGRMIFVKPKELSDGLYLS